MRGGIPKAYLMDGETMQRVLTRMAHQIMEQEDVGDLLMVGIRSRGVPLAHRLANVIEKVEGVHVPVGELDITMYRDDMSRIGEHPEVSGTVLPETMTGRTVILVDDVLYTGRTVRAAMEALMDRGRASRSRLAVLIDWLFAPILWARTYPPPRPSAWAFRWRKSTAETAWRCMTAEQE